MCRSHSSEDWCATCITWPARDSRLVYRALWEALDRARIRWPRVSTASPWVDRAQLGGRCELVGRRLVALTGLAILGLKAICLCGERPTPPRYNSTDTTPRQGCGVGGLPPSVMCENISGSVLIYRHEPEWHHARDRQALMLRTIAAHVPHALPMCISSCSLSTCGHTIHYLRPTESPSK